MYFLRQTARIDDGPALEASGLVHRVRQPLVAGPHRTIIMLHGLGGSEDSTWMLGGALPRDWLVVTPRGIASGPNDGFAWRPREPDEWPSLPDFVPAVEAVHHFALSLTELYGADPEHLYFMGFSQGAATAFATAIAHPSVVRGIASVVGFVPTDCAVSEVSTLRGLPVFMAAGTRDELIPLARSRVCAETLRVAGADLTYREYDVGHKLSSQASRDLKDWWTSRP